MKMQLFLTVILIGTGALCLAQRAGNLEQAFQRLDRDRDGKVDREEAGSAPWFDRIDRNRDGVITPDEVRARRPGAAGSAELPNVAARLDVPYGDHDAQRLDVYAPKAVKDAPVMVYVHGGGWRRGDKAAVGRKVEFFTGQGWVFVSVNYRLLPEGKHPANVQDVARAIAWVHDGIARHRGDPDAIFLMGHSAGCHLASLVATDGRHLEKAGKSLAVVKGVVALDTQAYDIVKLAEQAPGTTLYAEVFGDDAEVLRDASPIYHVAKGKGIPPFLICCSRGISARRNPNRSAQGEAFAAAFKASGVEAEVVNADDRNHGQINQWFGDPGDDKVTGKATAFLNGIRGKHNNRAEGEP